MRRILNLWLAFTLAVAGCGRLQAVDIIADQPAANGWRAVDLRAVFGDGETDPAYDLVAASVRLEQGQPSVRLDVLDLSPELPVRAILAIDDRAGGLRALPWGEDAALEWDFLISAPQDGLATVTGADGRTTSGAVPWLERDDALDMVVFHLQGMQLNLQKLRFQAFMIQADAGVASDSSEVFDFTGSPPARAPLLLAFWNALPAGSPAQALRRWNGAHTGPEGHRHGLYQLLSAARKQRVPLALLDLEHPQSLAGLDLVNGLALVTQMQREGLLLVPDLAYGDPTASARSLETSRRIASRYGMLPSDFLYGTADAALARRYRAVFTRTGPAGLTRVENLRLVGLPAENDPTPADAQGPAIETRRALLAAARSGGKTLTVLGGSVPESPWADAVYAGPALAYIAQHAWIEPLDGTRLLELATNTSAQEILAGDCTDVLCSPALPSDGAQVREDLRGQISALENSTARELATQMYLQLTQPTADARSAALQNALLPQTGYLIAAGEWAAAPAARSSCEPDPDGGQVCSLASERLFAVLHSRGARLALLAGSEVTGLQQWIGPTAQFTSGLSDPAEWDPDAGAFADPRGVAGAFLDTGQAQQEYTAEAGLGWVRFHGADGAQKTYTVDGRSLTVTYENMPAGSSTLSLTPLPELREQPGWAGRYRLVSSDDPTRLEYGSPDLGMLRISASMPLTSTSFVDAGAWLRQPEDPDHAYPPGHFLPIPLLLLQFDQPGSTTIRLEVLADSGK